MKPITKLWIGLIILVFLSPLGIILPAKFNSGSAWGEWNKEEVKQDVGYIPEGMDKLSDKWSAPMPDYAFKGQEEADIKKLSISYILSAILGIIIVVGTTIIIGKLIAKREKSNTA